MKSVNISITPARLVLAAFLVAGLAHAASIAIDYGERWVKGGGLTVGPTYSTSNRITAAPGCQVDYDFAAITAAPGYEQFTPNYTCAGVKLGDPCLVGVAAATPADGGSAWVSQVNFNAIAKADGFVVIKLTTTSGDAGPMDPPDAGYKVRCISNVVQ